MRQRGGMTLLMVATLAVASPAAAEMSDAAYCAKLAELAMRYTGRVGLEGELKPTKTTMFAMEACRQGDFANGIPVLEQTLRDNRFTLPAR
jgi:hypothetical protein